MESLVSQVVVPLTTGPAHSHATNLENAMANRNSKEQGGKRGQRVGLAVAAIGEAPRHIASLAGVLDGGAAGLGQMIQAVEGIAEHLASAWDAEECDEARARNVLVAVSDSLCREAVGSVEALNLWGEGFTQSAKTTLVGLQDLLSKWEQLTDDMTVRFWPRVKTGKYQWTSGKFAHAGCRALASRIDEIVKVRTGHEQALALSGDGALDAAGYEAVFAPFRALASPATATADEWSHAVGSFERSAMAALEGRVAQSLRQQLSVLSGQPAQLAREFRRFASVIARPAVSRELTSERELLVSQLMASCKAVRAEFGERFVAARNVSDAVAFVAWARQTAETIREQVSLAETVASETARFKDYRAEAEDLLKELKRKESDRFEAWKEDKVATIGQSQSRNGKEMLGTLMKFDLKDDGRLVVNYASSLVTLLREVRQLSALSLDIPPQIRTGAETAQKYYSTAVVLKQVANFYNQIGSRIIHAQKSMLLDLALKFEKIVKNPSEGGAGSSAGAGEVTWGDYDKVETYVNRLKGVADELASENQRLRKMHQAIGEDICRAMGTSLLREPDRWKEIIKSIRKRMDALTTQGYSDKNTRPWKAHWDFQLYKALEHQFQMGLESLHETLPVINVELTFKQGRLQFKPSFEEVRTKYYKEISRFLGRPAQFTGFADTKGFFSRIPDSNAAAIAVVYKRAEDLFERLDQVQQRFVPWTVLGTVADLDAFLRKLIDDRILADVSDWESNFKAIKTRGKDLEKLPNEEKVDCIHVDLGPVKRAVQEQLDRLSDALVLSLRVSTAKDLRDVEVFVKDGLERLGQRLQSADEIAAASRDHGQLSARKKEFVPIVASMKENNKLLRSVVGQGLDLSKALADWEKFVDSLESFDMFMAEQKSQLKGAMETRIAAFNTEVNKFAARWAMFKPTSTQMDRDQALATIKGISEQTVEFGELRQRGAKLSEECVYFDLPAPQLEQLEQLARDMEAVSSSWQIFSDFQEGLDKLILVPWLAFRAQLNDFYTFVDLWSRNLAKRVMETRDPMALQLNETLEGHRRLIASDLLKFCRGEMFQDAHWSDFFKIIQVRGLASRDLLFRHILDAGPHIIGSAKELKHLQSRAQGEHLIREALDDLKAWKMKTSFVLTEHGEGSRRCTLIKEWKDVMTQIGDHQSLLASLKDSIYFKPFEDEAKIWSQKLADLDAYLQALAVIQRKWVYLEPIFSRGSVPYEKERFRGIDRNFRQIMDGVRANPIVMALTEGTGLMQLLEGLQADLEKCQKALSQYLEEKRSIFPRFYFIGDDDLLEILGQAKRPEVIQSHLKKLFQGIHTVAFSEDSSRIIAIKSSEGEVVILDKPAQITDNVEEWLEDLSSSMKGTLTKLLVKCVGDTQLNPQQYPSQILCLSDQIHFTRDCEAAITKGSLKQFKQQLDAKLADYTSMLGTDRILTLKIQALVMDLIHNIDVVNQLIKKEVSSTKHWEWARQLRFYMNTAAVSTCIIRMSEAQFDYTYEYQGNAQKLVHTPLTDKCYLTLTQGMHLGYGGNPYGPAGTGKTESVKALAQAFGRQCLVFNCDEGIDFKSMGRIFSGLVKCGAWGCFDEFNRLEEDVLSAVSMQIQTIQEALKKRSPSLVLMEKELPVNPNAGIFVTLNPAGKGYGGRQKLPDNLKALFRSVSMKAPDNDMIAEVILYSDGFLTATDLARKLVSVFTLSRQLLSPQQHYDWGLRALKTVLRGSGALIQEERLAGRKVSAVQEAQIVIKSLRINTLSKLTFADFSRFLALIGDVFPGVPSEDVKKVELEAAVREVLRERHLQELEPQINKIIQFNEALTQRMGVVIVGPSGCGKTTMCQVLQGALEKLGQRFAIHKLNAKAMPRNQLLGHMNLDTREWFDGVLTKCSRQMVAEPQEVRSWTIADGDIDPEWIESLNSVLDDNHLLTMPSGERIQFGNNVNFIFETHSLKFASPATVSRMGMIFLSDEDMDIRAIVASWLLKSVAEDGRQAVAQLVKDYFYTALEAAEALPAVVETTRVGLVLNGLSHLARARDKATFAVGLVRGLGGNLSLDQRAVFAKKVFTLLGERAVDSSRPLDTTAVDGRLVTYENLDGGELSDHDLTGAGARRPVVPTVEVQRNLDMILPWVEDAKPFLVVGPEGAGKAMLLDHVFTGLKALPVAVISCSAQTTGQHVIEKLKQSCTLVSTPTGREFKPKEGERIVLYLKDINLPRPDKYNTIPLIAFLQQVLTYRGFYDEATLEFFSVNPRTVQIVGSMNASTQLGRHALSTRFTAIVRIAAIGYPEPDSLSKVYSSYIKAALSRDVPNSKWCTPDASRKLAGAMIELYEQVKSKFSVDDHAHYQFTPRDLTRWVEGLLRYSIKVDDVLKVFMYEAHRLFRDRIVGEDSQKRFDMALASVLQGSFRQGAELPAGTRYGSIASADQIQRDKRGLLVKMEKDEYAAAVRNSLLYFEREVKPLGIVLFPEALDHIASVDSVLSRPGGHLLLAGRNGVGRRSTTMLVAKMCNMEFASFALHRDYELRHFKEDLRGLIERAARGDQVVLFLEDFQVAEPVYLEMINSLLSGGEIPGLYGQAELDALVGSLAEEARDQKWEGKPYGFFVNRVQRNLHIVLSMDPSDPAFLDRCQRNPAIYTRCSIQWWDAWSKASMQEVAREMLKDHLKAIKDAPAFLNLIAEIHASQVQADAGTPRQFVTLVETFKKIFDEKRSKNSTQQGHLKAGLKKLAEAAETVNRLSAEAVTKRALLAESKAAADRAMDNIQKSSTEAGAREAEAKQLKAKLGEKEVALKAQKAKIDAQLADIQPVLDEASKAVGEIKHEQLNEIRSLRAPPEVVAHVLEAVLSLMGINDVTWSSMKKFLGNRSVVADILNFDTRSMSPEIRKAAQATIDKNRSSFDPANARKASLACAPLAAWATAQVTYSQVLEKISPLEAERAKAEKSLLDSQRKVSEYEKEIAELGEKVKHLQKESRVLERKANDLERDLEVADATTKAAQTLIGKLSGERKRWEQTDKDLDTQLERLPTYMLLSAAFVTYLADSTEGVRAETLAMWSAQARLDGGDKFRFNSVMSTESQQLVWKSEGLPGDALSLENANVILESLRTPLIIDPAGQAARWLLKHFEASKVKTIVYSDKRFTKTLENAVRVGETLVVTEVDQIEPILYPLLRRDLFVDGSAYKVFLADKKGVMYNESFRLYLVTRNPQVRVPPDAASAVTTTNFSVTRSGLEGQLLGLTIQHEQPELEIKKSAALKTEEDLKIQLSTLEKELLENLATSEGDILTNKKLIDSLNETKSKSETIAQALAESKTLQASLDEQREEYRPVARAGSNLFFLITDLAKLSGMYQFSLESFERLFRGSLEAGKNANIIKMQQLVFKYVCRALLKTHQLAFAVHLVHGMHPGYFAPGEWELLTGQASGAVDRQNQLPLPDWASPDRLTAFQSLCATFPQLVRGLRLDDGAQADLWRRWAKATECERDFPKVGGKELTSSQKLLVVQALRPDRLQPALAHMASSALQCDVAPDPMNLARLHDETTPKEPVMIIISPGADPSQELEECAKRVVGEDKYHQVAMGQGQADIALAAIREAAKVGGWVTLKNIHLVTAWLHALEAELSSDHMASPHPDFRLWLTTEPHPKMPPVLVRSCLKVTYEAPPGLKKNLLRTYEAWTPEFLSTGPPMRAQALFTLAYFHALISERRTYVPQGFVKFYEFSFADLRGAGDIVQAHVQSGSPAWEHIHGLLENAVYGGHIDSVEDCRVIRLFLKQLFSPETLSGKRKLHRGVSMPASAKHADYVAQIEQLPDEDGPALFGLPLNADRSVQSALASVVASQLKSLDVQASHASLVFDREVWATKLQPTLALWEKLVKSSPTLLQPPQVQAEKQESPIHNFVVIENAFGKAIVAAVDADMKMIGKVIAGTALLTTAVSAVTKDLLVGQVPARWSDQWEGPEHLTQWLTALVRKTVAIEGWLAKGSGLLKQAVRLSELFNPAVFFNALRQQTARQTKQAMDSLKLVASWAGSLPGSVTVTGLMIQGAAFQSGRLVDVSADHAPILPVEDCALAWIPKTDRDPYPLDKSTAVPVYLTSLRDKLITEFRLPCAGEDEDVAYTIKSLAIVIEE